jgi:capsular polysaccharide export protein
MPSQSNKHYTEQTIFWCPPLQGQQRALTRIWHQFPEQFNQQQQRDFVNLVNRPLANAEQARADAFLQQWQHWQVSCYNQYRPASDLPPEYLLIISSGAKAESLAALIAKANDINRQQGTNLPILVVPDNYQNLASLKQQLSQLSLAAEGAPILLNQPGHHACLLQGANHIVVYNSWLGFEALLWQKPLTVLGTPFYAGLGLSNDSALSQVSASVTLQQLLFLVLLEYSYSTCPHTDQEIPLEQALNWLSQQNTLRSRFPATLYAIGFGYYWRPVVRQFLQGSQVHFVKHARQVPAKTTAVVWGIAPQPQLAPGCKLIRLEDGFMRSVGLGALFVKPLSWVADCTGMYFDATVPSGLEQLLQHYSFSDAELQQAGQLRQQLLSQRLSKYNTGNSSWQRPVTEKKLILVAGQVETDASIACGAPGIKHNLALLQQVRRNNLDAYIIYKPHPDVVAGARASGQDEQYAIEYCDQIVRDANISAMLPEVDEVHVITSLAGFEALLRQKKVVCYGLPFYAGWGLTDDHIACSRRSRNLTLDQLVAGALMLYPLYLCAHSGYYSTASQTADTLAMWQRLGKKPSLTARVVRFLLNLLSGKR